MTTNEFIDGLQSKSHFIVHEMEKQNFSTVEAYLVCKTLAVLFKNSITDPEIIRLVDKVSADFEALNESKNA